MKRAAAPLAKLVTSRILFFAGLAIALQSLFVLSVFYLDDPQIADKLIRHEATLLAEGVRDLGGEPGYVLAPHLLQRYADSDTGYFTRIRNDTGTILYSNCEDRCEGLFLSLSTPPDRWIKQLAPGKPISATGGVLVPVGGHLVDVQVATVGDPDGLMWQVLADELLDHMLVPIGLTLLLVVGGTIPSILALLRPIRKASSAAETLNVADAAGELDPTGMPAEVASLTISVNRAFARIRELLATQRLLTSAISHEVRTPLAIVHLELQRIDHPRARKALGDIDDLVRFVTQLTSLARLEGSDTVALEPLDLVQLAARMVQQLAPFVYEHRHEIVFEDAGPASVSGNAPLLENALRNLIENAVRHTPDGTKITVTVKDGSIVVADNATRGSPVGGSETEVGHLRPGDGLGIGHKIVRRIMSLHGGSLIVAHNDDGTIATLTFYDSLEK